MTRYPQRVKDQVAELRSEGLNQYEIAKLLGIPRSTVAHWLDPAYKQKQRQYRSQNKDKIQEYLPTRRQKYRENQAQDPEFIVKNRARVKAYREKKKVDPDWVRKERLRRAEYKRKNPGAMRGLVASRRAAKNKATPPWLSAEHRSQIKNFYDTAVVSEEQTGVAHHVDHIVPLKARAFIEGEWQHVACGLHVPWNLQVLPADQNCSKSNCLPDQQNCVATTQPLGKM